MWPRQNRQISSSHPPGFPEGFHKWNWPFRKWILTGARCHSTSHHGKQEGPFPGACLNDNITPAMPLRIHSVWKQHKRTVIKYFHADSHWFFILFLIVYSRENQDKVTLPVLECNQVVEQTGYWERQFFSRIYFHPLLEIHS